MRISSGSLTLLTPLMAARSVKGTPSSLSIVSILRAAAFSTACTSQEILLLALSAQSVFLGKTFCDRIQVSRSI